MSKYVRIAYIDRPRGARSVALYPTLRGTSGEREILRPSLVFELSASSLQADCLLGLFDEHDCM